MPVPTSACRWLGQGLRERKGISLGRTRADGILHAVTAHQLTAFSSVTMALRRRLGRLSRQTRSRGRGDVLFETGGVGGVEGEGRQRCTGLGSAMRY